MFAASTSHLRVRHGHEHHRVTYVELFFDLVFVFAVTQLSHGLLKHLTPLGVVQTALLMLASGGCGSSPPGGPTGATPSGPQCGWCSAR